MNKTDPSIKTLGVVIFPDFELLDVFGPLEMFGHLPDKIKIILIAEKAGPVKSYQGPSVLVDVSLQEAPSIDFLLVPGGLGTRKEVNNKPLIEWIKQKAATAEITLSVCTGAALLAKAGVLDGRKATTNKMAFNWVATYGNNVTWVREARWVDDGNIVTSSGVAAGTDMSLYVISRLYGRETTESLINTSEYIWNSNPQLDPFSKNIP
jgi:transcriptional regulator GlxA family with amidase domain